jgi:hypothetical protein
VCPSIFCRFFPLSRVLSLFFCFCQGRVVTTFKFQAQKEKNTKSKMHTWWRVACLVAVTVALNVLDAADAQGIPCSPSTIGSCCMNVTDAYGVPSGQGMNCCPFLDPLLQKPRDESMGKWTNIPDFYGYSNTDAQGNVVSYTVLNPQDWCMCKATTDEMDANCGPYTAEMRGVVCLDPSPDSQYARFVASNAQCDCAFGALPYAANSWSLVIPCGKRPVSKWVAVPAADELVTCGPRVVASSPWYIEQIFWIDMYGSEIMESRTSNNRTCTQSNIYQTCGPMVDATATFIRAKSAPLNTSHCACQTSAGLDWVRTRAYTLELPFRAWWTAAYNEMVRLMGTDATPCSARSYELDSKRAIQDVGHGLPTHDRGMRGQNLCMVDVYGRSMCFPIGRNTSFVDVRYPYQEWYMSFTYTSTEDVLFYPAAVLTLRNYRPRGRRYLPTNPTRPNSSSSNNNLSHGTDLPCIRTIPRCITPIDHFYTDIVHIARDLART